MSTALQTSPQAGIPALAMSESDLMEVLSNSLYPGAKENSIRMVVGYCRASQLDPMQKPVHIVPMSVSTGQKDNNGWDIKEMRDVIMPGIGLYRTQASRSGECAGVSEPEFGEDVTEILDGVSVTYPRWCKVTVQRLLSNGMIAHYVAKELWKENYATKSSKSEAPNQMWKKRPYAQLAKCAEAQALRKAFPEVGSQPTAEEMEGRELVEKDVTPAPTPRQPALLPPYPEDKFSENLDQWKGMVDSGRCTAEDIINKINTRNTLSAQQESILRACDPAKGATYENA
ncbi:phage recombination protein Bet [Chromobacterium haemolyticum]|uniref:phage recombination protein Bet n=1 Tax=Chromobacterium haemolyticum TaxID=394935 RepID=UPI0009D99F9E|nr:phage recombination protein Bet [Chromobacterium haemolyticum]OQS40578.1 phage recombination protein Bet [Chromobacterium haemolyticum]PTU70798.1 phage recombination protein Bet [Chromobacterium haemolyticum]